MLPHEAVPTLGSLKLCHLFSKTNFLIQPVKKSFQRASDCRRLALTRRPKSQQYLNKCAICSIKVSGSCLHFFVSRSRTTCAASWPLEAPGILSTFHLSSCKSFCLCFSNTCACYFRAFFVAVQYPPSLLLCFFSNWLGTCTLSRSSSAAMHVLHLYPPFRLTNTYSTH